MRPCTESRSVVRCERCKAPVQPEPNAWPTEADQHVQRARGSERRFLSGMLDDPIAGWNKAGDAGIDHKSFLDPRHSKLFDLLCHCALQGIPPTPWLIREMMKRVHFPFLHEGSPNDELAELWWLEPLPSGLAVWAGQVAFYASRRRQAERLTDDAADCLAELAPDGRDWKVAA